MLQAHILRKKSSLKSEIGKGTILKVWGRKSTLLLYGTLSFVPIWSIKGILLTPENCSRFQLPGNLSQCQIKQSLYSEEMLKFISLRSTRRLVIHICVWAIQFGHKNRRNCRSSDFFFYASQAKLKRCSTTSFYTQGKAFLPVQVYLTEPSRLITMSTYATCDWQIGYLYQP